MQGTTFSTKNADKDRALTFMSQLKPPYYMHQPLWRYPSCSALCIPIFLTVLTLHHSFTVALVCYVLGSPISAFICCKFKLLRSLIMAGFTLFLVWAICMATISLDGNAAIYGYQAFLGTALALILNAVVASSQLSAPPELM